MGAWKNTPNTVAVFWSRVDIRQDNECWNWKAGKSAKGYGYFHFSGKQRQSHQMALAFSGVHIPDGQIACHHCDNPTCCNPKHLFVGTKKENNKDRARKGRSAGRRFDQTDIQQILALADRGETYRDIARRFQCGFTAIRHIATGRKYHNWTGRNPDTAPRRRVRKIGIAQTAQIQRLRREGLRLKDIAPLVSLSISGVWSVVAKMEQPV